MSDIHGFPPHTFHPNALASLLECHCSNATVNARIARGRDRGFATYSHSLYSTNSSEDSLLLAQANARIEHARYHGHASDSANLHLHLHRFFRRQLLPATSPIEASTSAKLSTTCFSTRHILPSPFSMKTHLYALCCSWMVVLPYLLNFHVR